MTALLALLLSVLLVAFLWRFQPQIWHRNRSLLLFGMTLVVSALAIRIAGNRSIWTYAIPTSAAVMLIGILLEGYAGAAMAAALAVVAGVVNPSGFEPAVYVLSSGMASLLAIVSAERLNAFLRTGLVLALTNIAVVLAFGLMDQTDVAGIAQLAGAGVLNAFLSVVLAVGSFAMAHMFANMATLNPDTGGLCTLIGRGLYLASGIAGAVRRPDGWTRHRG